MGFSANIGECSITMAELWGIYIGLSMASSLRVSNLILETDSACAQKLLATSTDHYSSSSLIRAIKDLLAIGEVLSPMPSENQTVALTL